MPSRSTKSRLFEVKLTPYALSTYKYVKDRAFTQDGKLKTGSRWVTVMSAYDHIIGAVIPEHATNPQAMLGRRGNVNLHGIYRHKTGRTRIFWIASDEKKTAIVLFIGETRKQGDKKDPYRMIEKYLRSGVFDDYFIELEISNPLKS